MNFTEIKKLVNLSNHLDKLKLYSESDVIDLIIKNAIYNDDEDEDEDDEENEFRRLIIELINNPGDINKSFSKYKHIFKTENGSVYFVNQAGNCERWRAKDKIKGNRLERQPLTEKIYYISENDGKKILNIWNTELIYLTSEERKEVEIPVDCSEIPDAGLVPLELNLLGYSLKNEIEVKEDGKLEIRLSGPFHVGHKIVEIYK